MELSLDTLPLEVLSLIVFHLGDPLPRIQRFSGQPPPSQGLAPYATISRKWQAVVERYTFSAVKTSSINLTKLKSLVAEYPRRRNNLRALFYQIDLPTYSKNRNCCFERRREHQANLLAFCNGVRELWEELSLWSPGNNASSGLRLVLSAQAAVPFPAWRHRWAFPEHSLTLDADAPALPDLPCISSLQLAETGRSVHPTAIGTLLGTLVNLQDLNLKLWPIQRKHRALVTEHITALARALESPTLFNLKRLRIWLGQHTPDDHNYETALGQDPDYPDGDMLNRAVFKLMQRSLRELYLEEAWMISPALWGAGKSGKEVLDEDGPLFPYLRIVSVRFPLITYDGRWLYTGDPREIPPLEGDTPPPGWEEDSAGSDSDSNSSFNSEFGDEIPYYREGVLNGDQPGHPWRVRPDPDTFHPVARALAAAVLRMPRLEHLSVGTASSDAIGYEVDFEYLAPGLTTYWMPDTDQTLEQREKRRFIVSLSTDVEWDVPEDIQELMERRISADGEGEVIFYKM